ncbi:unnamed protein product [Paramecium pentaurelia]|uniref:Uncharacterized protein n=1 Tax=Paramecium pentaurelia TaxID=43138 RepID=A0A8S1TEW6_9CILI|nr:unnamed protein product [Paramecium pentaurelia]
MSLIEKQIKTDTDEVIKQLKLLSENLIKLKRIFQGELQGQNEETKFIAENTKFLEQKVRPKIDELYRDLDNYEKKVEEIKKKNIKQGDIKYYYEEFDLQMQRYYDFYKIIWAQVYYFVQRQRILLNKDSEKKQQLIQKLLQ